MKREQSVYAPNVCPECGEAAYIGMNEVECTFYKCRNFHEDTWQSHILALPDDEEGVEFDIEEEPTQPRGLAAWLPDDVALRTFDPAIDQAYKDMGKATTGSMLRFQGDRLMQLYGMKEEYAKALSAVDKAIDTAPVPCYNVDDGSESE